MKKEIITAVIPAKGKSNRLKNKNLLPFDDSTLLEFKIKQLKRVDKIDRIIVSSESDKILEIALRYNGVEAIKRPIKYTYDETPIADFFEYIYEIIDPGVLVWACCTSPLVDELLISRCIDEFKCLNHQKYDSLVTMYKYQHYLFDKSGPHNFKLGIEHAYSQNLPVLDLFTNGVVIINTDNLIKYKSNFGPNPKRVYVDQITSVDIDNEADYIAAKAYWEYKKCK